jgi:hypothetical protein
VWAEGDKTMATFRIWYIGTENFSIEDATSEKEACEKLGWESQECRVQRIPEEVIVSEV